MTEKQKDTIADIVEDCPFALEIVVQILDSFRSNKSMPDPIEYTIKTLSASKAEQGDVEKEGWKKYDYIMDPAYRHIETPAQCCGCCISEYPGSFSKKLLSLTKKIGNNSNFQDCVNKLSQNSLLDRYTLDDDTRYKMHSLIKRYFESVHIDLDCSKGYREMFALFFCHYCALPEQFYSEDLAQSSKVLALDYHHFQRLLL